MCQGPINFHLVKLALVQHGHNMATCRPHRRVTPTEVMPWTQLTKLVSVLVHPGSEAAVVRLLTRRDPSVPATGCNRSQIVRDPHLSIRTVQLLRDRHLTEEAEQLREGHEARNPCWKGIR